MSMNIFHNREVRNKGFTLMEIMVVVLVIGLLTAIATPAYLTHTKDAKVKRMQADLNILSNAILLYQADNYGNWPIIGVDSNGDGKISDKEVTPVNISSLNVADVLLDMTAHEIDGSKLKDGIHRLNGEFEDYIVFILGPHEGKVFHKHGVEAGNKSVWFGIEETFKM